MVQFGEPIMNPVVCVGSAVPLCIVTIFGRHVRCIYDGQRRLKDDAIPKQVPYKPRSWESIN